MLGQVIRYDSSQHRSVPIKIRPKNTIFIGQKRKNSPVFSKYTDKPLPISKIITYFASQNKKQSARATLLRNLQCSSLGLYRKKHKRAMKDKYIDLIEQSFDFPQDEFSVEDNELHFHDIPLMELIKQYGTPLKITYLPKISQQINRAKRMFNVAMAKVDYKLVQLLLLHQVEPLLVRARGGDEERHPPRDLVGLRHPHHQRPLRRRHHRQGPLHHLQRIQAPAVCREPSPSS